ncbi:hypothetical protein DPEC_G00142830 [Dallia pectoralis]|uniref:Uncharacterized protein n=1 Tax=Dallia pectoralis TaxID=75939 RepID=A0ACC2GMV6_DALPE|nr:hypothetical protein DPEC_G00142830 [Dallia pectoralis]
MIGADVYGRARDRINPTSFPQTAGRRLTAVPKFPMSIDGRTSLLPVSQPRSKVRELRSVRRRPESHVIRKLDCSVRKIDPLRFGERGARGRAGGRGLSQTLSATVHPVFIQQEERERGEAVDIHKDERVAPSSLRIERERFMEGNHRAVLQNGRALP